MEEADIRDLLWSGTESGKTQGTHTNTHRSQYTLKLHHSLTLHVLHLGIPPAMMKLMYKGLLKDDKTLREAKISNGTKMMVVGSTVDDVLTIQPPNPNEIKPQKAEQTGNGRVLMIVTAFPNTLYHQ